MPDPGRSTDPRTVASVGTTNASAALTAPAGSFFPSDVGRPITGTGIPAGRTITLPIAANGSTATMSGTASATGTITATLGAADGSAAGFRGWSPETEAEAGVLTVASKNAGATDHNRPTGATRLSLQRSR